MKSSVIKIVMVTMLLVVSILPSIAQVPPIGTNDGGQMPDRIDRSTIPAAVTETYVSEYPATTYEAWYIYSTESYTNGTEWYVYTPSVVKGPAEYYVVEFTSDQTPYKVIYTKEGKRVSTYKTINTEVPAAVNTALSKSTYKSWTVTKEKEEAWLANDNKKVYRIVVEKGKEKHFLYYLEDGKLLADKKK